MAVFLSKDPGRGGAVSHSPITIVERLWFANYYACELFADPNPGYVFNGWSGDAALNPNTGKWTTGYFGDYKDGSPDEDARCTAHFAPKVPPDPTHTATLRIEVGVEGNGQATTSGHLFTGRVGDDADFTLRATPAQGWEFKHWKYNGTVYTWSQATWDVTTYISDRTDVFIAVFEEIDPGEKKITVNASAGIGGTVSPATDTRSGEPGSLVSFSFTATPNEGYRFVRWERDGEEVSNEASYVFLETIGNEDVVIGLYAVFEEAGSVKKKITVNTSTAGGGTVSPSSHTEYGNEGESASFTVVAEALPGCRFKRWERDGEEISNASTYTFSEVFGEEDERVVELVGVFESEVVVISYITPGGAGKVVPEFDYKYGEIGDISKFTFTATPNDGYRFLRWTFEGAVVSRERVLNIEKTHEATMTQFIYVAEFRKGTGLILRSASSGKILRGSSGNILRDE